MITYSKEICTTTTTLGQCDLMARLFLYVFGNFTILKICSISRKHVNLFHHSIQLSWVKDWLMFTAWSEINSYLQLNNSRLPKKIIFFIQFFSFSRYCVVFEVDKAMKSCTNEKDTDPLTRSKLIVRNQTDLIWSVDQIGYIKCYTL